jgi:hypothetical protein
MKNEISDYLRMIDDADNAHSPTSRAAYADALIDVLRDIFTDEEMQALAQAKADGRLVILPCKVGDTYSGICREMVPDKKGWKTKEWIETGVVVRFIVTAELTAEKVDYNHQRNIDEVGEVWFVGEGHREAAEKALGGGEE